METPEQIAERITYGMAEIPFFLSVTEMRERIIAEITQARKAPKGCVLDEEGKVFGTLPRTADGVPVTPGMTVYPPCGHAKPLTPDCFIPVLVKKVSCWEGSCHHEFYGENDYHESDPTAYPVSKCFSTHAAALTTSQEGKNE